MIKGQRVIYDLDQLKERMVYWQELLRLQAWDIEVRFYDEGEEKDGITANNSYDWHSYESLISMVPEEQYQAYGNYDMEFVLLHEMLHLIIDVKNKNGTACCEQAVNQMARALLLLNRKGKGEWDGDETKAKAQTKSQTEKEGL